MRGLALLSLILAAIFALMIGISLRIGQGQAAPERIARLHLADCDLPCWNGITPGVTSASEAKARIDPVLPDFQSPAAPSAASQSLIWTEYGDIDRIVQVVDVVLQNGTVEAIGIGTDHTSSEMPTLREALALFGAPTCVTIDDVTDQSTWFYEDSAHHFKLQFSVALALTSSVNNFVFGGATEETCQNILALPWHDFRTLEPSFLRPS